LVRRHLVGAESVKVGWRRRKRRTGLANEGRRRRGTPMGPDNRGRCVTTRRRGGTGKEGEGKGGGEDEK